MTVQEIEDLIFQINEKKKARDKILDELKDKYKKDSFVMNEISKIQLKYILDEG